MINDLSAKITTKNHRRQPHRPKNPNTIPESIHFAKIIFEMIAHNRHLTFSMIAADQASIDFIGEFEGQYYIRVPENENVQVEISLSNSWDWKFMDDGESDFTLATAGHELRYWIHPGGTDQNRTITIESSKETPEHGNGTGKHDEKFNLGIKLAQLKSNKTVGIEIDPIVKNPPPTDGQIATAGQPGPLL